VSLPQDDQTVIERLVALCFFGSQKVGCLESDSDDDDSLRLEQYNLHRVYVIKTPLIIMNII